MAIAFVGQFTFPTTENANDTGTTLTLTTSGLGASSGDVVIMFAAFRETAGTMSVTTTGGQSWTEHWDVIDGFHYAVYSCVFNGTWSANPVITTTEVAAPRLLWATVWSGVDNTTPWDVGPTNDGDPGGGDQTYAFDTNTDGALALLGGGQSDNNTGTINNSFTNPSGSGNIYWRSAGGSDFSIGHAVKLIPTAGAIGTTTLDWAFVESLGIEWHGALKPASAGETIDGVVLTVTPSLPAGTVGVSSILGVVLTVTPTLPIGSVSAGGQQVDGIVLTVTPTLPVGVLTHTVTGVVVTATPTLPVGKLNHSVTGVTVTATPTLPAGSLRHTLTGLAVTVTPTLPAGALRHTITGIVLTATPSLPVGQVTVPGAQTVTGIVLQITPTLPVGALTHRLTGIALTVTPTLPVGEVTTPAPQTVTGVVLTIAPTLPAGVVAETSVLGVTLTVTPVLPAGTVVGSGPVFISEGDADATSTYLEGQGSGASSIEGDALVGAGLEG